MTTPSWMPQFPYSVEDYESANGISADVLREADRSSHERFASKAIKAYKASLKPAAYMNDELPYSILSLVPWTGKHNIPLYRLDDQP